MLCDSKFCSHVDHVDSDDISVLLCSYVVEPVSLWSCTWLSTEPGVTARGAAARKLPRGGQGQEPHPGQPVVLAGGQGRRPGPGAERPARPAAAVEGTFEIARSLPHGHVAAVLGTARALGLEELLDPAPSRQRDLVTAIAIAQVIARAPSWPSPAGCARRPPPAPSARCWAWRAVMRMTCTARWTGSPPGKTRSRMRSRRGTWPGDAGPLRRVVGCVRGPGLPAGRHRPPQRRGPRPAADRLRAAHLHRRRPSRHRGVRRATPATRRPSPPR